MSNQAGRRGKTGFRRLDSPSPVGHGGVLPCRFWSRWRSLAHSSGTIFVNRTNALLRRPNSPDFRSPVSDWGMTGPTVRWPGASFTVIILGKDGEPMAEAAIVSDKMRIGPGAMLHVPWRALGQFRAVLSPQMTPSRLKHSDAL